PIGVMPRAPNSCGMRRLESSTAPSPAAPVDRAGPPGHHEAEQPGRGHAGQADQADLDRQPAGAGDALVPRQPKGTGLQLAGDQRRPQKMAMIAGTTYR